MPQTVWKQVVPVRDGSTTVLVPSSARLVRLEVDRTDPAVVLSWWYISNIDQAPRERKVAVTGTGHLVPDAWVHLASCAPHPQTGLVWHLWDVVDA